MAKALEKDKARRYPSAGELAEDLCRYLAHEPIRARPASASYRVRRFVRRNKALVASGAVVFAALLAATIISLLACAMRGRVPGWRGRRRIGRGFGRGGRAVRPRCRRRRAQPGQVPEERRGWEWRHLHSRLDDSSAVVRLRPATPPSCSRARRVSGSGSSRTPASASSMRQGTRPRNDPSRAPETGLSPSPRWPTDCGSPPQRTPPLVTLRDETGRVRGRIDLLRRKISTPSPSAPTGRGWRPPSCEEAHGSIGVYDTTSGEERARSAVNPEKPTS